MHSIMIRNDQEKHGVEKKPNQNFIIILIFNIIVLFGYILFKKHAEIYNCASDYVHNEK